MSGLSSHDITPFGRNAGQNVSQWVKQMEFRFKSVGIPENLWVSGILAHVQPEVWSEMQRYLVRGEPDNTPYEAFAEQMRELYRAPDLARAAMFQLGRAKQLPEERLDQFRMRVDHLIGQAYHHLAARDREPMAVNAFMVGLADGRIVEHLLTQKPANLAEAQRIAQEYVEIKRSVPDRGGDRNRAFAKNEGATVSGSLDGLGLDSFPVRAGNSEECAARLDADDPMVTTDSGHQASEGFDGPRSSSVGRWSNLRGGTGGRGFARGDRAGWSQWSQQGPRAEGNLPAASGGRSDYGVGGAGGNGVRGVVRCFKCDGIGHGASECPSERSCFKCGKPGHWANQCWQQGNVLTRGSQAQASVPRGGFAPKPPLNW